MNTRRRVKGGNGYSTQTERDGRDDGRHPQGVKAQRKKNLPPTQGHGMALGAAGRSPHGLSLVSPWALGQES